MASSARNNLHNLKPIAGFQLAMRKFRRRHRLAIVFHYHASGQKILREEKLFKRARKFCFDWFAVGGDKQIHGVPKLFVLLSKTTSSVSPNAQFSPAEVIVKLFVELK